MAEEIVQITIGADGRVAIEVRGIGGTGCLDATEDLLALLGGDVDSQEMTAEAYVEQEQTESAHAWQKKGRT
jgi:hypothetical protein